MSKFLRQTCVIQQYQTTSDGQPVYNDFGELQFSSPRTVKCRREQTYKSIQTANGTLVKSFARYFLDENSSVRSNDRIDGHIILDVSEYTGSFGQCEGFEVYV